jgi:hypothetical protein
MIRGWRQGVLPASRRLFSRPLSLQGGERGDCRSCLLTRSSRATASLAGVGDNVAAIGGNWESMERLSVARIATVAVRLGRPQPSARTNSRNVQPRSVEATKAGRPLVSCWRRTRHRDSSGRDRAFDRTPNSRLGQIPPARPRSPDPPMIEAYRRRAKARQETRPPQMHQRRVACARPM